MPRDLTANLHELSEAAKSVQQLSKPVGFFGDVNNVIVNFRVWTQRVERSLQFEEGQSYIAEWSAFADFGKPEDELSHTDVLQAVGTRAEWLRKVIQELRNFQRLYEQEQEREEQVKKQLVERERVAAQLETQQQKGLIGDKIFIGHGRSKDWLELALHLTSNLNLKYDEYNRNPNAGKSRKEVLEAKLAQACMAFLVMTAEDEQPDGQMRARENVIHEVGLFQGRIGFHRAIILLEEGCNEFSNIAGLDQVRFSSGKLASKFGDIDQVLKREGILK